MVEKEPRFGPLFHLPQMPGRQRAASEPPGAKHAVRLQPPGTSADIEDEDEIDEEELAREPGQHPLGSEVSGELERLSRDTGGMRVRASTILKRALLNFAEQDRHRSRLVTILLTVQAAILVALLPGAFLGQSPSGSVLLLLSGLVLFGLVWLCNRLGRVWEACYLLVIGGGAFVVAMMLFSASHQLSLETLQLSLLFLPVILSSGLLFSPETALFFSIISASFTASVSLIFPLSSALAQVFAAQGRYLPVVFLLVAQLGVGMVGWLFGRQMQESVHVVTYLAGLEMSNKRLRQRLSQITQKKRSLEEGIAVIQQTHARVAAGDYGARAHVEGDLLPLAVSLNLMLERVDSFLQSVNERERMESAAAGLAALAGRVGQGAGGTLPAPTGTVLDGVSMAIKQMQADVNQRLARVQQSAALLLTAVGRCQEMLMPVADALVEHLRNVDALVLAADNILTSSQRQIEMAARAEALLRAAAPPTLSLDAGDAPGLVKPGTSALRMAEELERRLAAGAIPSREQIIESSPAGAEAAGGQWVASGDAAADMGAGHADEGAASEWAEVEMMIAEGSPVFAPTPVRAAVETALSEPPALVGVGAARKMTLADVDREAAEEAAMQAAVWDIEQLRVLVEVLTAIAGEAAQQERNARTLHYKLHAMVQGMPDTRRDMLAAWMRAALGAISTSATQVIQASKPLQASPLAEAAVSELQGREKH
jgi:hypothetical protein